MEQKAFQDYYTEEFGHCYGCGPFNKDGWHIKSYWDGEESVARFTPEACYTGGFPGFVYGGLIAAVLDCHGNGTAAAAAYRAEGRVQGTEPVLRYVTASLKINFHSPTPMGTELEIRGKILEVGPRKVVMELYLKAAGKITVTGEMVAVRLPSL